MKRKKIGLILTCMLGAVLLFSAYLKLSLNKDAIAQAALLGFSTEVYFFIGIVEAVALILFFIPRTGVLGTLLLAAYLGGAIATHLQHEQSIIIPTVLQALVWITAVLRFPELTHRILMKRS